ncbi:lysophospholipid acyltransferase family protein [Gephyromycinifex aptenodytis]|uniref:lysophospholipid acyltransferase family protein n=1 Tax=Gephyromycinifex aptenodytis TaxID=2716227 RepID=UPI00144848A5|nr:lysophospholipid acyltransferase family protein [Gephyromycinifex aptenodytis]
MEPVYTPVIGFARIVFAAQGLNFKVTGAEHIPTTGGAVIVMNHLSYFDFAYAGLAARPSGRVIRFMCKDSIFEHPVAGPLMRGMKHISVDRDNGSQSFRDALRALKSGELVGVFPEATISRSFEVKALKSGAIRMAQAARVPLIPLVLWGSQRVWTKGQPKHLGRTRTPISLDVGEPHQVERRADIEQETLRLREQMTAMVRAAQEAYPPMSGEDLIYVPARMGGLAPTLEAANAMDVEDARRRRLERAARAGRTAPAEPVAHDPSDPIAPA